MRKIIAFENAKARNDPNAIPTITGFFHGFKTETSGGETYTVAIIEESNGDVQIAYAGATKFIKESEQEHDVISRPPRTEQEIVDGANKLARELLRQIGYELPETVLFYRCLDNPRISRAWDMAVTAYEQIDGTDVNNALAELGIE